VEDKTMQIRRASERGYADHGWLRSFHTFSFADYRDPRWMGFRALRVINEDRVAAGGGFPTHPHADMEIISYVLDGQLAHRDSMGTGSVIRPGEVQRMSAGTGVYHSEMNGSKSDPVHFLQIWILPDRRGHQPGYEQKAFPTEERDGKLRLVASGDGREGSVTVHQDVNLYGTLVGAGQEVRHTIAPGRHAWVQVARGSATVNGTRLDAGDAAYTSDAGELAIAGVDGGDQAELLVFDLS
jgi:redox-sensitive bicupin YhaK (pirin superfamily)